MRKLEPAEFQKLKIQPSALGKYLRDIERQF